MALKVATNSPSCFHPLSMEALPNSVSPAKQNNRCTQNTCSDDWPISARGLTANGLKTDWKYTSTVAAAAKFDKRMNPKCHLSKRNSAAPNSNPCEISRRSTKNAHTSMAAGITTRLAQISNGIRSCAQRHPNQTPTIHRNCQAHRSKEPISFSG